MTSIENPLPVDENTLFLLGSVTKTFTATAIMRLVSDGRVSLDAPVRTCVPELKLLDDREFTVRQLLNHTSGLDWGTLVDTGEGDDALAGHVAEQTYEQAMASCCWSRSGWATGTSAGTR